MADIYVEINAVITAKNIPKEAAPKTITAAMERAGEKTINAAQGYTTKKPPPKTPGFALTLNLTQMTIGDKESDFTVKALVQTLSGKSMKVLADGEVSINDKADAKDIVDLSAAAAIECTKNAIKGFIKLGPPN